MRISFFAGDTITIRFSAVDALGSALNLENMTIEWALSKPSKTVELISKTVGSGITITDADGGLFEIRLMPTETQSLDGEYYQEVQISEGGIISTIYAGSVHITKTLIP